MFGLVPEYCGQGVGCRNNATRLDVVTLAVVTGMLFSVGQDSSNIIGIHQFGVPRLGSLSSCRILVVDDFHPWREFVCALVGTRKQWQIVGEAADGMEAIEKAVETKPDVVLLDVGLPALSGIDASSRLCEAVPGVRVVFLTAYQNREIVHAAFSNGAQGYVLKAHAHSELLTAVEAVLRGEKFLSRRIQR